MKLFLKTIFKIVVLSLVICFAFLMLKDQIKLSNVLLLLGLFFLVGIIIIVRDAILDLTSTKKKYKNFPNYQKPNIPSGFKDYAGDVVYRLKNRRSILKERFGK